MSPTGRHPIGWRRHLTAAFTEHLALKASAVLVAVVLWFVVAAREPTEELVNVRFAPQLDSALVLRDPNPVIRALVIGRANEILKLSNAPLVIRRPITSDAPGSPHAVALSGPGVSPPTLSIPTFTARTAGQVSTVGVAIGNPSGNPVTFSGFNVTLAYPAGFVNDPSQPVVYEYGRTGLPERASDLHLAAADVRTEDVARWRASPFFRMLQTGESLLWRRVTAESEAEFPVLRDYRTAGMIDYVAIINRFAPEGIIGEMDCVYSSWLTARADGFADAHITALTRVVPTLALAFKRPRSRA